jgi:hypothetical protein
VVLPCSNEALATKSWRYGRYMPCLSATKFTINFSLICKFWFDLFSDAIELSTNKLNNKKPYRRQNDFRICGRFRSLRHVSQCFPSCKDIDVKRFVTLGCEGDRNGLLVCTWWRSALLSICHHQNLDLIAYTVMLLLLAVVQTCQLLH